MPKVNGRVHVVMEKRVDLANLVRNCEAGGFQYSAEGGHLCLSLARSD